MKCGDIDKAIREALAARGLVLDSLTIKYRQAIPDVSIDVSESLAEVHGDGPNDPPEGWVLLPLPDRTLPWEVLPEKEDVLVYTRNEWVRSEIAQRHTCYMGHKILAVAIRRKEYFHTPPRGFRHLRADEDIVLGSPMEVRYWSEKDTKWEKKLLPYFILNEGKIRRESIAVPISP